MARFPALPRPNLRTLTLAVGLLCLGFGLVAYVILNAAQVHSLYNSDILLPVALHENSLARPGGYFGFQQARILSFFPDQAVYHPLALLFDDARMSLFAYALIAFAGLTYAAARAIQALWPDRSLATAALGFALVFTGLTFVLGQIPGMDGPYGALLLPVNHSGPLAVSLWLFHRINRPLAPQIGLLAVVIGLTSLSDALFLLYAVAPLGLAALTRLDTTSPRAFAASVWCEKDYAGLMLVGLCGVWASTFFFSQGAPGLTMASVAEALTLLRTDLLAPVPFNLYYLGGLIVLIGVIVTTIRTRGDRQRQMIYIAAAMGLPVIFFVLYYGGQGASRYLLPMFVWPLIFLSGVALHGLQRMGQGMVLASVLTGLAAGSAAHGSVIPALNWRDPTETCVSRLAQTHDLRHGLAEFWVARPIAVSSDFRLRVEQISPDGRPYVWGNDPYWYLHDADGGPARFDFIVLKDLDEAAIRQRFGAPSQRLECPGTSIWLYDNPRAVAVALARDNPQLPAMIRH